MSQLTLVGASIIPSCIDAHLVTQLWFSYLSDHSADISSTTAVELQRIANRDSFGSCRNLVVVSAVTESRPKPCFTITALTKTKNIASFGAVTETVISVDLCYISADEDIVGQSVLRHS